MSTDMDIKWDMGSFTIGFLLGLLVMGVAVVAICHFGLSWHDKAQMIVKYDSSLYKLVPVKYIE